MGLKYQRLDETFSVTQAGAADVENKRIAGVTRDRLVAVIIHAIQCDNGAATGAAITTVNFVATPNKRSDLMGGSSRHYFATLDSFKQSRMVFEAQLEPGEDLMLAITNGTAGRTTQWRVERTLVFDDGQPAARAA